jgi:hypothetical protein
LQARISTTVAMRRISGCCRPIRDRVEVTGLRP